MFDSIKQFFQNTGQWFTAKLAGFSGNPTHGPLGDATVQAAPVPAAIANFRDAAITPGPSQDWLMGSLREQGVSPYDFGKFCAAFAEGCDYVFRKYGTSPAGIMITDLPHPQTTFYNFDSQTIYISRQWIGKLSKDYLTAQEKTDPHALTPLQMATMYGVEEAFHHYQYVRHADHYLPLMEQYRTPSQDLNAYRQHPLEADAKIEVQQAMKDYGYDRMPIAPGQDARWQSYLAKQQEAAQHSQGSRVHA